jgi:integrase
MARGSVFTKSNGWAFRIDAGVNPETGKRRQILRQGFKTKRAAEHALAEAAQSVTQGTVVAKSSMKVDEFVDQWLDSQRGNLRPSTHHSYTVAAKRLRSGIGHVQVQALTPLQIESFYADLMDHGGRNGKPLSGKTVRNTHVVLRKALGDAERLGIVHRNAAASAKGPSVSRPEFDVWSSEDVRTFLTSIEDHHLYAAYLLLATTGMRRGEVLGLRWRDVDLDARQLAVVQSITLVADKITVGKPKTARSRRVLYLDDKTVAVLRAHRERQRVELRGFPDQVEGAGDLVFRDEAGEVVPPEWFSKEFRRLREEAGVPKIRLHDIRHTYATLALKAGVHVKVVSERLGHSSIAITLDLYSHVTPGIARDAADQVAAAIFGD